MSSVGFLAGLGEGARRSLGARSLGAAVFALVTVAAVAVVERRAGLVGAANRTLENGVFGVILPLALLGASTRILDAARLDTAATALARFGPSRRSVAFGLIAASMVAGGLLAALAGAVAALLAHDPTAPPRALDAATCAWIGAVTGCAYAGIFALGATFGARGGGRLWALALDFVLGSTGGFAALIAPHAHARNLLGGEPPLLLSQPASLILLVAIAAGFTGLAVIRCPR